MEGDQIGKDMVEHIFTIEYFDPRKHHDQITEAVDIKLQLLQRLDELEQQYLKSLDAPIGVNLTNGCDEMLYIGLGGESWILGYCRTEEGFPIPPLP